MCNTGSRFDRATTVATTNPPSRCSCTTAPPGATPRAAATAESLVTTRGQPGRLAGRVDTANLHRHRCDAGQAQHEYRNQNGDTERRFHRGRTGIVG